MCGIRLTPKYKPRCKNVWYPFDFEVYRPRCKICFFRKSEDLFRNTHGPYTQGLLFPAFSKKSRGTLLSALCGALCVKRGSGFVVGTLSFQLLLQF